MYLGLETGSFEHVATLNQPIALHALCVTTSTQLNNIQFTKPRSCFLQNKMQVLSISYCECYTQAIMYASLFYYIYTNKMSS